MSLNLSDIQALMHDFEQSSLREFKLDTEETHLYLSKNDQVPIMMAQQPAANVATPTDESVVVDTTVTIKAPLVGTVYLAPKPEAANFKSVGDTVAVGETVAIVEAMKLMTEVKSDVAGVITAVNVDNEAVVGYDDILYTVQPA